ncbi:cation efflux protein [Scheffersomyces xylosifermentans]|uniref:cation efflux protein n=1 Tax=Scheffersomyces xylosifermentans TaxID=1304137 RepID=UPI00315DC448
MNNKELRIGALLTLDTVFFLLEAIIGYSVHSLALIADSFHMLNDIISLIIALWAVRVKNTKPADGKYTYGWQRAEILGALINAVFLLALCFTIIIEAIQRFFEPAEITQPKLILIVGVAGLISNGVGLVLFHEHGHSHSHGGSDHSNTDVSDEEERVGNSNRNGSIEVYEHGHSHSVTGSTSDVFDYLPDTVVDRYSEQTPLIKHDEGHSHGAVDTHTHENEHDTKKKKSLNMEGVFLHVMGDALGNIGVIITALFIWKTDFSWRFLSDPITSLVITVIIFSSALPLCLKSSKILLQATPTYINSNLIVQKIVELPLVKSVHDFHVWNLNEDILIASLHIELEASCYAPVINTGEAVARTELAHSDTVNSVSTVNDTQIDKAIFLQVVSQVREVLHKFGIHSVTIQPERLNSQKRQVPMERLAVRTAL